MRLRACLFVAMMGGVFGCSSSNDQPATPSDAGSDAADAPGDSLSPNDPEVALPCTDTKESIYGDPGTLPADKGAIIKCSKGERIAKGDLQLALTMNGYSGKPLTSGAKVYRVLYRTERGNDAKTPGYTSAAVYLPDTPRATKLPIVVVGHGSRGQAAACVPSNVSPAGQYVQGDFNRLVYTLVGFGYAAIIPDLAGMSNYGAANNPPSAYADSADVGKSMLDGTRALQKLVPSILSDKTVIVGHSQGGHSALSALAMVDSYGLAGTISATVVYAPLWFAQRTWGALLLLADSYPIKDSPTPNAVSVWYHYTHGELLDGPGHGGDVFAADKRDGIKKFVDSQCWAASYPSLEALGTTANDLFDPTFKDAVAAPAGAGADCPTDEPKKSLCEKWMARYAADRPSITSKSPILFLYGNKDTTLAPDRMTCARDKLAKDMANVTYCVEPDATHGGIIDKRGDYAAQWIASQTLGEASPGKCTETDKDIIDPSTGMPASCNPLPPNDP